MFQFLTCTGQWCVFLVSCDVSAYPLKQTKFLLLIASYQSNNIALLYCSLVFNNVKIAALWISGTVPYFLSILDALLHVKAALCSHWLKIGKFRLVPKLWRARTVHSKNTRVKFDPIKVKSWPESWSICHRRKPGQIDPVFRVMVFNPDFRVNY